LNMQEEQQIKGIFDRLGINYRQCKLNCA